MALRQPVAEGYASQLTAPIELTTQVLYGLGQLVGSIRLVTFGLFLFFFYTTVMGLPGTLVGVASAIGLVWNALVDPLIGHASDHARWRLGRRHGFMFVGAMTVGVTFWALFSPPRGLGLPALFAWLVVTSLLVRLASGVFGIPYSALGAELSQDYHERSRISGIRGACGLLGYLLVASLSFVVFFPNRSVGVDPKLNYDGYPLMGLAFGAAMTVFGLVATLATLKTRPRRADGGEDRPSDRPGFVAGIRVAFQSPAFRSLMLATSLIWLGVVINGVLFIHFVTYFVKIGESRALSTLQFAFYGSALVGVPLWLRVAKRVEKRWLFFTATVAAALLMTAARLLVGPGRFFGTGDVRPLLVGEALAGLFASLFWIVPASMAADVADEDELHTGRRREGIFFGIMSFGEQVASGISVVAAGVLIDRFAGLVPGQAEQTALTIERIGLLYSFLPAALLFVAAFLVSRYPLDRRKVLEIQSALRARA